MSAAAPLVAEVQVERIRDVFGRRGTAIMAGTAMMALLAVETVAMAWQAAPPFRLVAWLVLILVIEFGGFLFIRRFHAEERPPGEVRRWGPMKAAQEAFHGYGWSLAIPFVYQGGSDIALLAATTTLIGLAASIAPGLAVYMPAAIAFLAGALLPAALFLVVPRGPPIADYAALMLVVAFVLNAANALRWSGFYWEGITLRLDMAASIEERRRLIEAVEAAAAERTRFFGAASHDLRQPVHALGLYASLLEADPPKAERRELIRSVAACVQSLETLFAALLDLSRPASEATYTVFPVDALVAATVLKFRPDAAARKLALVASGKPVWARGDHASVERILGNLVSNAVRYTEAGGVVIRARRAGERVAISIVDSGPGIGAAERERIFDPFYRTAHASRAPGLGLGLATVRELCRNHGYGLRMRSRPGRGTLFRLSLAAAEPAAPEPVDREIGALRSGLHVLLVEDDPYAADAAARVLTGWGIVVRTCANRARALELIAETPSASWHVLVDYRLADDETGLEIAAAIRAVHGEGLPITLITGEADPAVFAAADELDVPVLRKPLKPIRLRARLAGLA